MLSGRSLAGHSIALVLLATAASAQQIPFKLEIEKAVLSHHQRMAATLDIQLDGVDVVKRVGKGELLLRIEIRDQQGKIYASSATVSFRGARTDERKAKMDYSVEILVLPGVYHARVRLVDPDSGQEGSAERDFKVDALSSDPLPEMWRDLPAVEFATGDEGPEHWLLPFTDGRLHLPLESRSPVKVDLLVNTTPTEFGGGPERQNNVNLSALMPVMKTIFQIDVRNGSLEMALLDLAKLKAIYSQDNRQPLDWPRLKNSLEAANPNVIDVHSLANRTRDGDYFVYEVGQRVRAALKPGEPRHVLIVLSGPMNFPAQVMLHRADVQATDRCKVFYVRYQTGVQSKIRPPIAGSGPQDELEFILGPLRPRKFEATSPMEFRKALAAIFAEIALLP